MFRSLVFSESPNHARERLTCVVPQGKEKGRKGFLHALEIHRFEPAMARWSKYIWRKDFYREIGAGQHNHSMIGIVLFL